MAKKLTKAEARARAAEWSKAVAEGRVIRYSTGMTLKSFPTTEARDAELARLEPGAAEVVRPIHLRLEVVGAGRRIHDSRGSPGRNACGADYTLADLGPRDFRSCITAPDWAPRLCPTCLEASK